MTISEGGQPRPKWVRIGLRIHPRLAETKPETFALLHASAVLSALILEIGFWQMSRGIRVVLSIVVLVLLLTPILLNAANSWLLQNEMGNADRTAARFAKDFVKNAGLHLANGISAQKHKKKHLQATRIRDLAVQILVGVAGADYAIYEAFGQETRTNGVLVPEQEEVVRTALESHMQGRQSPTSKVFPLFIGPKDAPFGRLAVYSSEGVGTLLKSRTDAVGALLLAAEQLDLN